MTIPTHHQESEETRNLSDVFRNWREDLDPAIDEIDIVIEDTPRAIALGFLCDSNI